jgi:hypothetical protein
VFESLIAESFMEAMGVSSACELTNPLVAYSPPSLVLSRPLECLGMDSEAVMGEEPSYDLVISRSFCHLREGIPFPPPIVIKEELTHLVALSKRYVLIQYPSDAPFPLAALAANLNTGFALEGFLPHRYPDGEASGGTPGDFYFFVNSQGSEPLPAPFGISGGPSKLSPIKDGMIQRLVPSGVIEDMEALASKGRLPDHLPFIYKLVRLRPWDLRARTNLALNLMVSGEGIEGERVLKGILAENPQDELTRMALCRLYLEAPDYENLRAFLPELNILHDTDPRVAACWERISLALEGLDRQSMEMPKGLTKASVG